VKKCAHFHFYAQLLIDSEIIEKSSPYPIPTKIMLMGNSLA
jgi:hypothetical protein